MEFSGERYIPELHGNIELEHLNRYLHACAFATGKIVLDIACGEGYGSAMLASKAEKVIGVDISVEAVKHARRRYKNVNLEFKVGNCKDIPLPDASVDFVVSFETLEHHDQHEKMMQEVKRILRPNGILLISTPDKYYYSIETGYNNPFHIKELYQFEFKQILGKYFKNISFFGQRVIYGSSIISESLPTPVVSYLQENETIITSPGVIKPTYWIAFASDAKLPKLSSSILEQPIDNSEIVHSWREIVTKRDQSVQILSAQVSEREEQVQVLMAHVTEKEQTIQSLSAQVTENEQAVQMLSAQVSEREEQVRVLMAHVAEKEQTIQSLSAQVTENEQAVQMLSAQVSEREEQVQVLMAHVTEKEQTIQSLSAQVTENEQAVQMLSAQVSEREEQVRVLMAHVAEKEQTIQSLSAQVAESEQMVQGIALQLDKKEQSAQALTTHLAEIESSKAWKIALLFRNIRILIAPPNSRRARVLRRLYKLLIFPIINIDQNREFEKDIALVRSSGLFDKAWYLSINPDVVDAKVDVARHYLLFGGFEGRDPSPHFSSDWYLNTYEDVKKIRINPLVHYLKYGKMEGRMTKPYQNFLQITEGNKNTPNQVVHAIRTFLQLITIKRIGIALRYFIHGDIGIIKHKLLFLSQNINPSSADETELELIHCAQFFRLKVENHHYEEILKQKFDIIVPVFNGMDFLPRLFDSLYKNTDAPFRMIIIDDNSTDISVRPFLENLAEKHKNILLLFNGENKGFVKTVNIASIYVKNHFVILNTDVEVPKDWLQRLMKPLIDNKRIASTTPFTNAGTIFSFPEFNVDNKIFAGLDVDLVDSVFKLIDSDSLPIDVPTGVGFCMGVNFDVWKDIGKFDENTFGRGYGEENDWCLRATSAGYRNVIVPNLFVYHKHGGSFLPEEKQKLIQANSQKLFHRYPNYPGNVENYIKSDPLKSLRMFASMLLMILAASEKPALIIDRGLGGGADDYCNELIENRLRTGQVIFLLSLSGPLRTIKLQVLYKKYKTSFKVSDIKELLILIDYLELGEILYNNLVGYSDPISVLIVILQLKNKFKAKLMVFVHDYYLLCPSYTLIDNNGNYCDLPSVATCKKCLPNNRFRTPDDQSNILMWRKNWSRFLDSADEVVCFSRSSKNLIMKTYYLNKINIVPHTPLCKFLKKPDVNQQGPLCIGIVGALNYQKGLAVVVEAAKIFADKYPEVKLIVVGDSHPIRLPNVTITGRYTRSDLPHLLEKYNINLCFFSSIWPETFSYVTSELIELEMPICSFNLGAPSERIGQYKLGYIISEINAETAVREMVEFYNELKLKNDYSSRARNHP